METLYIPVKTSERLPEKLPNGRKSEQVFVINKYGSRYTSAYDHKGKYWTSASHVEYWLEPIESPDFIGQSKSILNESPQEIAIRAMKYPEPVQSAEELYQKTLMAFTELWDYTEHNDNIPYESKVKELDDKYHSLRSQLFAQFAQSQLLQNKQQLSMSAEEFLFHEAEYRMKGCSCKSLGECDCGTPSTNANYRQDLKYWAKILNGFAQSQPMQGISEEEIEKLIDKLDLMFSIEREDLGQYNMSKEGLAAYGKAEKYHKQKKIDFVTKFLSQQPKKEGGEG